MDDPGVDRHGDGQAGKQHPFIRRVRIASGGAEAAQGGDSRADEHIALVAGPGPRGLPSACRCRSLCNPGAIRARG